MIASCPYTALTIPECSCPVCHEHQMAARRALCQLESKVKK